MDSMILKTLLISLDLRRHYPSLLQVNASVTLVVEEQIKVKCYPKINKKIFIKSSKISITIKMVRFPKTI